MVTQMIAWLIMALAPVVGSDPSFYQPARSWQVSFNLHIQGEYQVASSNPSAGYYLLETEWYGFIEEDGLDFIIYHLGTCQPHWLLTASIEQEPLSTISLSIPPPNLKLDYIEGKEQEISFYYSLEPEVISHSGQELPGEINLLLPSIPWNRRRPEELQIKRKVQGIRDISFPRKDLNRNEVQKTFSWQEESLLSGAKSRAVFQKSKVKVTVELRKYDIEWNSSPRMKAIINLFQPLPADMGIYLSSGNLTVTEKHLDRAQVCPAFQKVSSKGMPEDMGMYFISQSCFLTVAFKYFPDSLPGKSFSPPG